jgi:hypothetical protein
MVSWRSAAPECGEQTTSAPKPTAGVIAGDEGAAIDGVLEPAPRLFR